MIYYIAFNNQNGVVLFSFSFVPLSVEKSVCLTVKITIAPLHDLVGENGKRCYCDSENF